MPNRTPSLTDIKLHQVSHKLEIKFNNGETFKLSCEYLRVYSQSADITGHTPDQAVLQVGKQDINIDDITPVGNYAVKLHFSDGHNTGIYTWERLYDLGKNHNKYWVDYLRTLMRAGHDHADLDKLKAQ